MTEREREVVGAIMTRHEHPELISWRENGQTHIVIGATINFYIAMYLDSQQGIHMYKLHKRAAVERIPSDIFNNIYILFGCEVMLKGAKDEQETTY